MRSPGKTDEEDTIQPEVLPIHEIANKGLILVHLGQAHPAEIEEAGGWNDAHAQNQKVSGLTFLALSNHKARFTYITVV